MATRWPGWVYDEGEEPDPRFSFANERTFLAWVRTSLGLLAAGVALQALPVDIEPTPRKWLAVLFIVLALATGAVGLVPVGPLRARDAAGRAAARIGDDRRHRRRCGVAGLILLFVIGLR